MSKNIETVRKDSELWLIPQEWAVSYIWEFWWLLPWYAFKSNDFWDIWIPIIKIKNISETWNVDLENTDKVQDHVLNEKTSKFLLSNGDFIVAMTWATIGKVWKIKSNWEKILLNQRVGKFEIKDKSKLEKNFLYYNTQNKPFSDIINNIANGVAQANISWVQIESIPIPLPPLAEQQTIASTLWSLDDKIELLREQNRTLEKMGQSIFYEWFVNFNFPWSNGFMVESELGLIPKGWKVGKLGEIVSINTKSVLPNRFLDIVFDHYSIPAFDKEFLPSQDEWSSIQSNKTKILPYTILVSKLNPQDKQRIWFVKKPSNDAVSSTEFINYVVKEQYIFEYFYYYIQESTFYDQFVWMATGSTGSRQRTNPTQTLDLDIVIPSDELIKKYGEIIAPNIDLITINMNKIKLLTQTRDDLLPRLMSGKVRVF